MKNWLFLSLISIFLFFSADCQAQAVEVDLYNSTQFVSPNILIVWQNPYEFVDTAGYNVYKADNKNVYEKINIKLIPAEGTEKEWLFYQITDLAVKKGKSYKYKIEEVKKNGKSYFSLPTSCRAE